MLSLFSDRFNMFYFSKYCSYGYNILSTKTIMKKETRQGTVFREVAFIVRRKKILKPSLNFCMLSNITMLYHSYYYFNYCFNKQTASSFPINMGWIYYQRMRSNSSNHIFVPDNYSFKYKSIYVQWYLSNVNAKQQIRFLKIKMSSYKKFLQEYHFHSSIHLLWNKWRHCWSQFPFVPGMF